VLEIDPHLGKDTCGGAGVLLAWYPLGSADLGRVVYPGAVEFDSVVEFVESVLESEEC
jgi:hypothetical protein